MVAQLGQALIAMLEGEGATEETGGENVETNDGRHKFGVPDDETTGPAVASPHKKQLKPKVKNLSWIWVVRERPQLFQPHLEKTNEALQDPKGCPVGQILQ